ncbi:uncharacterized protein [Procambarus clarkii]|uniref:uncharacterized protein n=1 Tax=Procambarus clarkii TaxID=6728 RepID=UPI001E677ADC|nr:uncharacterized protein LOC123757004 [Procambarus clarkii]
MVGAVFLIAAMCTLATGLPIYPYPLFVPYPVYNPFPLHEYDGLDLLGADDVYGRRLYRDAAYPYRGTRGIVDGLDLFEPDDVYGRRVYRDAAHPFGGSRGTGEFSGHNRGFHGEFQGQTKSASSEWAGSGVSSNLRGLHRGSGHLGGSTGASAHQLHK